VACLLLCIKPEDLVFSQLLLCVNPRERDALFFDISRRHGDADCDVQTNVRRKYVNEMFNILDSPNLGAGVVR
jgi:hypothetical protein